MAYELLTDIRVVALGGFNKKTGQKNSSQLEGYWIGTEERVSKFSEKPVNFYIFQTQNGKEGLYASGDINKWMRQAKLGAMTRITDTGKTRDIGKGNPMRLYNVEQDTSNTIEVASVSTTEESSSVEVEEFHEAVQEEEEFQFDAVVPTPPKAPIKPARSNPSEALALLNKARRVS